MNLTNELRKLSVRDRAKVRVALHAAEVAQRRITERTLDKGSGAEGCAHDPYGWTSYIVALNGHDYCLRTGGLGYSRLVIDGITVAEGFEGAKSHRAVDRNGNRVKQVDEDEVVETWEQLTGVPVAKFERWMMKAKYRRYGAAYFEPDPFGHPSMYE